MRSACKPRTSPPKRSVYLSSAPPKEPCPIILTRTPRTPVHPEEVFPTPKRSFPPHPEEVCPIILSAQPFAPSHLRAPQRGPPPKELCPPVFGLPTQEPCPIILAPLRPFAPQALPRSHPRQPSAHPEEVHPEEVCLILLSGRIIPSAPALRPFA